MRSTTCIVQQTQIGCDSMCFCILFIGIIDKMCDAFNLICDGILSTISIWWFHVHNTRTYHNFSLSVHQLIAKKEKWKQQPHLLPVGWVNAVCVWMREKERKYIAFTFNYLGIVFCCCSLVSVTSALFFICRMALAELLQNGGEIVVLCAYAYLSLLCVKMTKPILIIINKTKMKCISQTRAPKNLW